jgi:preprotein translocase subunit SecG
MNLLAENGSFLTTALAVLFIIICILLTIVVLLQKGRGGGLSATFGGIGSSAFGTKVGDVFTWVTIILTALFLVLAVGASLSFRPEKVKVATPVFDATYPSENRAEVRISVPGNVKGTDIYYTLDGTTPTREKSGGKSFKYGKIPVPVGTGQTLKAFATLAGSLDSDVTPPWKLSTATEIAPSPATTSSAPAATEPAATGPASAPAIVHVESPSPAPVGK